MPAWLVSILIKLAITIGLPKVAELLTKLISDADLREKILQVIRDFLNSLADQNSVQRQAAITKREAKRNAKTCIGTICVPELKR